jgi:phosphopantothenoylcysteine decarboxylase / phosphopantothenate---cysteine ligase
MLNGKKVLVGVTGSIAAYKTAFLVRLLVKEGASVKVIMTPAAKEFITPLTLSTLSKNPVLSDLSAGATGEWNNHVDLGLWADMMVIAPASANTISKMASGACDNLLIATYLSARCKVYLAPAMDLDMLKHPATAYNLEKVKSYGNIIIPPAHGELASGLIGEGRMAEPEEIVSFLADDLKKDLPLAGKKALVSAGPTYEAIDPVRFIGNHSSGKMGIAIAEELARKGAEVKLVCGPSPVQVGNKTVKRIDVTTADEMYEACMREFVSADIAIMCAAVADYKPAIAAKEKIKKSDSSRTIELVPTKDILAELGRMKREKQLLVGFALETESEETNAKTKLERKNLDLIVLNSLRDAGAGFGGDTNKISIIDRHNKTHNFELKSKAEAAADIVNHIINADNSA